MVLCNWTISSIKFSWPLKCSASPHVSIVYRKPSPISTRTRWLATTLISSNGWFSLSTTSKVINGRFFMHLSSRSSCRFHHRYQRSSLTPRSLRQYHIRSNEPACLYLCVLQRSRTRRQISLHIDSIAVSIHWSVRRSKPLDLHFECSTCECCQTTRHPTDHLHWQGQPNNRADSSGGLLAESYPTRTDQRQCSHRSITTVSRLFHQVTNRSFCRCLSSEVILFV